MCPCSNQDGLNFISRVLLQDCALEQVVVVGKKIVAAGKYKFYLSKAKYIYKGKECELIRTFAIEKQAQRELHPTFGPLVMINGAWLGVL